jgi:hypothetical protein
VARVTGRRQNQAATYGTRLTAVVSDAEHELLSEVERHAADARRWRELARRALVAARDAQDARSGSHDQWIDDALGELAADVTEDPSARPDQ